MIIKTEMVIIKMMTKSTILMMIMMAMMIMQVAAHNMQSLWTQDME